MNTNLSFSFSCILYFHKVFIVSLYSCQRVLVYQRIQTSLLSFSFFCILYFLPSLAPSLYFIFSPLFISFSKVSNYHMYLYINKCMLDLYLFESIKYKYKCIICICMNQVVSTNKIHIDEYKSINE